jgi:RNA recognition motif-containing protein
MAEAKGGPTGPQSASNLYKNAILNSLGGGIFERNQEATIYVGNLEPRVNEELIWELFL